MAKTKKKRATPDRALTPSTKKSNWITPYQYGKRNDVRPQQVYQWVLKQGAPAKEIAGKIYINEDEITDWISKKDDRKKERRQKAAQKKVDSGEYIPPWLTELIRNQRLNRAKAFCVNEERVTEWRFSIEWTDLDFTGPYKAAKCTECNLNLREYPISKERAIQAMKNEITLRVPMHSSLKPLGEEEEWLGTDPPPGWTPREPDIEDEEDFQDELGDGEEPGGDDGGFAGDDEYSGDDD